HDIHTMISQESEAATACRAQITFGVTNRDGRQPNARILDAVRCTIANGGTSVNVTNLQDFCFQLNNLHHWVEVVWERVDAVERCSGAHHVEVVIGPEKDA